MPGQPFPPTLLRLYPRLTLTSGNPSFQLQNVITFPLADGCLCWVEAEQDDFRFLRTSTSAPGPDVVEPIAGPGRWHRVTGGGVEVLDEGVSLGIFQAVNFQGAGVTAIAGPPGQVDVTIPGGSGTAAVQGTYTCPVTVVVRDAVYLSAADTVDQADADDASKQPLIGIVDSKPGATTAIVTYYGEVSGFVGLTPGDTYYLSTTPGQITNVAPSNPGDIVQRIGFAKSATVLMVMVDRDWTVLT